MSYLIEKADSEIKMNIKMNKMRNYYMRTQREKKKKKEIYFMRI